MITYHHEVEQGSDAWYAARCGILTASEMKLIISPPPEPETRIKKNGEPYKQREWTPVADNDKCRAHMWELLAQRITRYVEPTYVSDDMLRGQTDEVEAKILYNANYAPLKDVGFVTNDKWGFTIGCSPDALIVGDDGGLESKCRRQKYQVQTIVEMEMPEEYSIQVQTSLLVTEKPWWEFISYSAGLPMLTLRIFPDLKIQDAIVEAATAFEKKLQENFAIYHERLRSDARLIPTERRIEQDMHL